MSVTLSQPTGLSLQDHRRCILAIIGGSIGNLVEWYAFYIYSFGALYFAPVFFPAPARPGKICSRSLATPVTAISCTRLNRSVPTTWYKEPSLRGYGRRVARVGRSFVSQELVSIFGRSANFSVGIQLETPTRLERPRQRPA